MAEFVHQINTMGDGRIIAGNYPDPAIQSGLEIQTHADERAKANFQAVVDLENVNTNYAEELDTIRTYYANKGLTIDPLRVVDGEVMRKAYVVSGDAAEASVDSEQGRSVNERAVILENEAMTAVFGSDYVLGIGLHEAAHSLSESRIIKTVQQNGNRIKPHSYKSGGMGKVDLRKDADTEFVGAFWEEAFADLTRVRALRELHRGHDLIGDSKPLEQSPGLQVIVTPNNNTRTDHEHVLLPAGYALLAKSTGGKNMAGTTPPNFAAYALDLLDAHVPGLYDDFVAATQDPKRQADAIRKIDSVQPGLYRTLRGLEYTAEDFVQGLWLVEDALRAADASSSPQQSAEFLSPEQFEAAKVALSGLRISNGRSVDLQHYQVPHNERQN